MSTIQAGAAPRSIAGGRDPPSRSQPCPPQRRMSHTCSAGPGTKAPRPRSPSTPRWTCRTSSTPSSTSPPTRPTPRRRASTDPGKGDWERFVDLTQWWLDRMATVPKPLQEKLTLFWHGHFATQASKVGSAVDMFDQNHLFRTAGAGGFESLVQQMSLQVAMLIYLDNDPNSKGAPNENFARELMELFTLGVNQYTQDDVVASATRVDRAQRRLRRRPPRLPLLPEPARHRPEDLHGRDPELGRARGHHAHPHRRAAALDRRPVHREEALDLLRLPRARDSTVLDALVAAFVGSNLDVRDAARARSSCGRSSTRRRRAPASCASPVEWIVTCLRALGLTAVATNPQWWMEEMGQVLFEPPNVAGWKNNAYWLNSTALWARRRLRPQPHLAGPRGRLPRGDRRPGRRRPPRHDARRGGGPRAREVRPRPRGRAGVALGPQRAGRLARRPARRPRPRRPTPGTTGRRST